MVDILRHPVLAVLTVPLVGLEKNGAMVTVFGQTINANKREMVINCDIPQWQNFHNEIMLLYSNRERGLR